MAPHTSLLLLCHIALQERENPAGQLEAITQELTSVRAAWVERDISNLPPLLMTLLSHHNTGAGKPGRAAGEYYSGAEVIAGGMCGASHLTLSSPPCVTSFCHCAIQDRENLAGQLGGINQELMSMQAACVERHTSHFLTPLCHIFSVTAHNRSGRI